MPQRIIERDLSSTLCIHKKVTNQGRIRDFRIEGAQKTCSGHHKRKARNPFNSAGVHCARLKALDSLRFQMLSHAILG